LELREVSAGLRPALEGLRPIVDWLEPEKILIATGHYRNGVLLAPLTSLAVTGMVLGDPYPSASLFGSIND
jgi:glycine oxidase